MTGPPHGLRTGRHGACTDHGVAVRVNRADYQLTRKRSPQHRGANAGHTMPRALRAFNAWLIGSSVRASRRREKTKTRLASPAKAGEDPRYPALN